VTLIESTTTCSVGSTAPGRKKYFTLLPREFYLDEEIFRQERDKFLLKHWHFAAHVSEIPKAGDYVVVELLGESIIVIRGRDGGVSALNNVCRHRGHSICVEPKGNKRRLTCPYHAWTYDHHGALVAAPSLNDGDYIDFADWSLKKVHVEIWQGCIFIALREPAEKALGARLDAVAPQMLPLEMEHMKQVAVSTKLMNANWKILVENYHECYHCAGNHPELVQAMDLDGMYEESDNPDRFTEFYGGGAPAKPGMTSLTMDGQSVSRPLLGEYGRGRPIPASFNAGFAIWPMLTKGLFSPDHGVLQTTRPLGHDQVEWTTRWYVHEDAVEGEYDVEKLRTVWDATNDQDMDLVHGTFAGVRSEEFEPGPLSVSREPALVAFVDLYKKLMGLNV